MAKANTERLNLVLPPALKEELERAAGERQISFSELVRRALKVALLIDAIEAKDGKLLIRERDGRETWLTLV